MEKVLAGYRSPLSVEEGERIDFMVHCADSGTYEADLIRIINGDGDPAGPGLSFEEIDASFSGPHQGKAQEIRSGSFAQIDFSAPVSLGDYSFALAVFPTLYTGTPQTIAQLVTPDGNGIAVLNLNEAGHLELTMEDVVARLPAPLPLERWSFVGFSASKDDGQVTLFQDPIPNGPSDDADLYGCTSSQPKDAFQEMRVGKLVLASAYRADLRPETSFNGRLEAPRLMGAALEVDAMIALVRAEAPRLGDKNLAGFWDFSKSIDTPHLTDLSPSQAHGRVHNLPNRAVRGFRWNGSVRDWKQAPREYGAIHFHQSDVYDMGWPAAFSYEVPKGLRSGCYAARLRKGEETEYLTFFVRSPRRADRKKPKIVFIAPTASYMSYSNELAHVSVLQALYGQDAPLLPEVQMFVDNPAFGPSQYQAHTDGSGVHYVSYLRPIWNLRPDTRAWAFPADTTIIHWLESKDFDYDVITDHDLQEFGGTLLEGYSAAITGTHPEYLSTEIFDAYESFLSRGGRLMYMGGNGFYWRVAFSKEWQAAMEVRRAEDGNRGWVAEPGEYHHAFDGEMGGLWRRQSRSPNRLVGVGFAAQGFSTSTHYRRAAGAEDDRAAFIFDGVEGDVIGDFGLRGGGAAGEEIDRFDVALGSPPHGLVLASSENNPEDMLLAKEEFLFTLPPNVDPRIRADIVFFETPSGGAVFSTGSIAWAGSLSHNGFENSVARMTENVLRRFIEPEPFVMPERPEPSIPSLPGSVPSGQRIRA